MVRSTKRESSGIEDNLDKSNTSRRRSRRSLHNSTLNELPFFGDNSSSPGKYTPRRSARTHNQVTYYPKDAVVTKRTRRRKTKKTKTAKKIESKNSSLILFEKNEEECSEADETINTNNTTNVNETFNGSPDIENDVTFQINANDSEVELKKVDDIPVTGISLVNTPDKRKSIEIGNISTLAVLGSAKCENSGMWDFPEYDAGVCDTPLSSLKRPKINSTSPHSRTSISTLFRKSAKDSIAKKRQRALINRLIDPKRCGTPTSIPVFNQHRFISPLKSDKNADKTIESIQVETKSVQLTFQLRSNVVQTKSEQSVTTYKRKRCFGGERSNNNENILKTAQTTEMRNTRGKMPNFSAIHQQNFNKMDSIYDHVNKKQERAKLLYAKNMKGSNQINTATNCLEQENIISKQSEIAEKQLPSLRPKFEFSKIPIFTKSINNAERVIQFTATPQRCTTTPQRFNAIEDKVAKRRERNMALYKNGAARVIRRQQVIDRTEFIHGVRSNRRFALQMKYRDENYK